MANLYGMWSPAQTSCRCVSRVCCVETCRTVLGRHLGNAPIRPLGAPQRSRCLPDHSASIGRYERTPSLHRAHQNCGLIPRVDDARKQVRIDGREVNSRGLSRQQMRVWARTAQCKPCPVRAELAGWDLFEHDAFFQVTEGEPDHCMVTLEPVESSRLGAVSPDSDSDDVVDGSFVLGPPGPVS